MCMCMWVSGHVQIQSEEQKQKVDWMRVARQKKVEWTAELKEKHRAHRDTFQMTRQPLLEGLASDYDMDLFKEAQARACELLVCAGGCSVAGHVFFVTNLYS